MMTGTGVMTDKRRRPVRSGVGLLAVLIVAVCSGVGAAQVLNPSFETTFTILGRAQPLPQDWWRMDHSSFSSYGTDLWSTDGDLSAALLSRTGKPFRAGNYQSFFQWGVDLTGVNRIVFDVRLMASAGVFDHFEAAFLIDGDPVWWADAEGDYYDQQVSLAGLPEYWWGHFLEIRLTALDTTDALGFSESYWAFWDNIRLVTGPTTIPAVIDLDPGTLNLGSSGRWVTCYIELPEGYDVAQIDGATVALEGIGACVDGQGWATAQANEGNIVDHDGDGVLERMVKFDRAKVQTVVEAPQTTVTIEGSLAGGPDFEGTAVLRVLDKGAKKK